MKNSLRAANVYRRLIQGNGTVATQLHEMLKKYSAVDWESAVVPNEEKQRALEELKARLPSPPVLAFQNRIFLA